MRRRGREGRIQRHNPYNPWSYVADLLCFMFGHLNVWGPRRGDGAAICRFCNSFLGEHKWGNLESLAKKMEGFEPRKFS